MEGKYQIDLKRRTRRFAVDVIKAIETLPQTPAAKAATNQLIRSAMSVGANYRASQRPKSTADMISKLKIVEEELDESLYWLELLVEAGISSKDSLKPLYFEGNELLSIVVASIKSLRLKPEEIREGIAEYGKGTDSVFYST